MTKFEKLEQLNAQIDIWIDEGDWDSIYNHLELSDNDLLNTAFAHKHCANNPSQRKNWRALFADAATRRILSVDIPGIEHIPLRECYADASWSNLFWAKLIRANIQKKGTDCYISRLDDVMIYLEHCLPKNTTPEIEKLRIIYLLELAACGTGADSRSFGERTRRILIDKFGYAGSRIERKIFADFYDLVARYNMGVSLFHERRYEEAVREFNFISWVWDENAKFIKDKKYEKADWLRFSKVRLGKKLVYYPAVRYRAQIYLKMQLAYHALTTLKDLHEFSVSTELIRTQAFQLIGMLNKSWSCLEKASKDLLPASANIKSECMSLTEELQYAKSILKNISLLPPLDQSHFLELMTAHFFERLRELTRHRQNEFWLDAKAVLIFMISRGLLRSYRDVARWCEPDRQGYLEQVSELLNFLVEQINHYHNNKDFQTALEWWKCARLLYSQHRILSDAPSKRLSGRIYFCRTNNDNIRDLCRKDSIELQRLPSDHYDKYWENILEFLDFVCDHEEENRYVADNTVVEQYCKERKSFLDHLIETEVYREDLNWRKKKFEIRNQVRPLTNRSFCEGCSANTDRAFSHLLGCVKSCIRRRIDRNGRNRLFKEDYEQVMNRYDKHFFDHLRDYSMHKPPISALHFLGLRRWNSSSPALGQSVGGGYLLYKTDKKGRVDLGVAIDPGFDFIRNLFHCGFSLADVDIMLLSHAHVDHVRDFESILALLFELKKRTKRHRRIHAIMTSGVYERLDYLIESSGLREFVEPYIIDIKKGVITNFGEITSNNISAIKFIPNEDKASSHRWRPVISNDDGKNKVSFLEITPTIAYHNDHSNCSDSFGFKIRLKPKGNIPSYSFGYTGDTQWHKDIMRQYSKAAGQNQKPCDALLVHLGSLIDIGEDGKRHFDSYDDNGEKCFKLINEKNHPYLPGLLSFLKEVSGWGNPTPLVLVGEFGEELCGGIRRDLFYRLKEAYTSKNKIIPSDSPTAETQTNPSMDILPVDVGLDVILREWPDEEKDFKKNRAQKGPRVWCVQCQTYIDIAQADFEMFGIDEALFCVCETCRRTVSIDVLQDRLRSLYEEGLPLIPAEENKGHK